MFEIGCTYRIVNRCLWLVAVSECELFTFRRGRPLTLRSRRAVLAKPTPTFEELCDRWEVSLDRADAELSARIGTPVVASARGRYAPKRKGVVLDRGQRHPEENRRMREARFGRPRVA